MSLYLFPGQGSQKPGMGRDFHETSHAARVVFEEAASLNPPGFLEMVFCGTAEQVNDTRVAQPALLTVEVAIARELEGRGLSPTSCAGHSLGELSALVVAGVWTFADAMRFTQERARAMSENVPEGGMAAVLGLDAEAIETALPAGVQVANFNGPSQTIITGTKAGLACAAEVLKAAGAKRVMPLAVSGPFHSEWMRPASVRLRAALEGVELRAPRIRFISSVSGGVVSDAAAVRELLVSQICSPVRWTDVMRAAGAVRAIEVGPGSVLKGLAKRMDGAPEVHLAGTVEEAGQLLAAAGTN